MRGTLAMLQTVTKKSCLLQCLLCPSFTLDFLQYTLCMQMHTQPRRKQVRSLSQMTL